MLQRGIHLRGALRASSFIPRSRNTNPLGRACCRDRGRSFDPVDPPRIAGRARNSGRTPLGLHSSRPSSRKEGFSGLEFRTREPGRAGDAALELGAFESTPRIAASSDAKDRESVAAARRELRGLSLALWIRRATATPEGCAAIRSVRFLLLRPVVHRSRASAA